MNTAPSARLNPEDLIACPACDVLFEDRNLPPGATARCARCHATLFAPRANAMTRIVMLAGTATILTFAAVFFPFLEINASGLSSKSSVMDAIMAFSIGLMVPLSVAVALLIVLLPLARLAAIAYALGPMALGHHPARYADTAMRFAERTYPWAMSEIFIVGVAVALVKIAGLAKVSLGPAFWAFVALVLVSVLQDTIMCRFTIWKTLEARRLS